MSKNTSCFNMPVNQVPHSLSRQQAIAAGQDILDSIRTGRYYGKHFNSDHNAEECHLKDYVLLLPNVSWDSAVWYFDSHIYKSQYEWLFSTMDYCLEHDLRFVVRCHPGEKAMQSKHYLYDLLDSHLQKKWPDARQRGDRFHIYAHTDSISTYNLLKKAAKAVVYVSTMGLEVPHYDVPCIVIGKPYYRDRGFNYFPQSKLEYFELLSRKLELNGREKENLYVYVSQLSNYRINMNYGDFYKYTGRDEVSLLNLDPEDTYGKFPFQEMELEKLLHFMNLNFTAN